MKQTTVPSGRFAFDRKAFAEGLRDGVPIGLGYFAVSVSLGIAARHAGMTPLQGLSPAGRPPPPLASTPSLLP